MGRNEDVTHTIIEKMSSKKERKERQMDMGPRKMAQWVEFLAI